VGGELRTVSIAKGSLLCLPQHLATAAADVFGRLAAADRLREFYREQFIGRVAEFLADVNALHPLREGNGRAQRAFFSSPTTPGTIWTGSAWTRPQRRRQRSRTSRRPHTAHRDLAPPGDSRAAAILHHVGSLSPEAGSTPPIRERRVKLRLCAALGVTKADAARLRPIRGSTLTD
jgi:Fic/DOC family